MGLDIFIHKVKRVRNSKAEPLKSINEYEKINDKRAKERFRIFAKRSLTRLEGLSGEKYKEVYNDIFLNKIKKYIKYEYRYKKMIKDIQPYEEVQKFFKFQIDVSYAECDAYFRKVNFLYQFFSWKLEDECCFISMRDIDVLIERCDEVLANPEKGEDLLPTRAGFFFGSTDYDDYYIQDVEDVKKQMTELKRDFNEDTDVIYVEMSW